MIPPPTAIETERLVLRPSGPSDAERAFEIQSNPRVTRMLRMAGFPPDRDELDAWFAGHGREWAQGEAYRFAILHEGRMIGLTDIDEIGGGEGDLGYWLDEPAWGQGFAREAAAALVRFGFETAGLARLRSGHAADNPASGRVLTALGFRHLDDTTVPSRSRGVEIAQRRYAMNRPER